jgi:N-acetylglutamate synthase
MSERDLPWRIEETCWNAFPSLKQVLLGDFLLRFSDGLSRRANSANPLLDGPGNIPSAIAAAEELYGEQGLPAIFRVPSIVDPALDRELAARGYTGEGESCVLHAPIANIAAAADPEVRLLAIPSPEWLAAMAALQRHAPEQAARYRRIIGSIAIPVRFAALATDGLPTALAYGALHDRMLCYESVITDPRYRGQGLARRVIAALADWARKAGAEGACLQVEAGNAPARALYDRFGLSAELYRYHYRREPPAR